MIKDNIVIVIDNSNYISSYAEKVPFKAKVTEKYDISVVVKSLSTNKRYELYKEQIMEGLSDEQLSKVIDLDTYNELF